MDKAQQCSPATLDISKSEAKPQAVLPSSLVVLALRSPAKVLLLWRPKLVPRAAVALPDFE